MEKQVITKQGASVNAVSIEVKETISMESLLVALVKQGKLEFGEPLRVGNGRWVKVEKLPNSDWKIRIFRDA